eukprot:3309453-Rhodomonas_salina.5
MVSFTHLEVAVLGGDGDVGLDVGNGLGDVEHHRGNDDLAASAVHGVERGDKGGHAGLVIVLLPKSTR